VRDPSPVQRRDAELIESIDRALAESARRSGEWLVCRPGCTSCCMGPFEITELDVLRLQRGFIELYTSDPDRAAQIRHRAARWSGQEDPCPALDPASGTCDLYTFRPVTCRVFGPPVSCGSGAIGVCELCYEGATPEQIAACAVEADPSGIEGSLLIELGAEDHRTTVAQALLSAAPAALTRNTRHAIMAPPSASGIDS
jgi:Fe-S-cluster containining protein